jgi:phosphoglycolate phosphatase/putative hydrolase of the HAD superfamily
MKHVDWKCIKLVVFDVDGTLYSQYKLRNIMLLHLLAHYMLRPRQIKDLLILSTFRKERERKIGFSCEDLENVQYQWCGERTKTDPLKVKALVEHWMYKYPIKFLHKCVYPGLHSFVRELKQNQIKVAVYSDYPAKEKLKALGIDADLVISSTDTGINSLKPNPKGLISINAQLNVPPSESLFIGDRNELDGVCAENAGMKFLLFQEHRNNNLSFYQELAHIVNGTFNLNTHAPFNIVS